jgi:sulfite reductase alpha subunit-like flavoprotein
MYDYANRPRRTIHEVLQEFRSAEVPIEYIADIFPEIRPRQFSIASSSRRSRKRVELLVAIVKYKTKLHAPRKGVATAWLATLKPGQKLSVGFTNGTMDFPEDPAVPIILIGPGTGIAPFRSFVQDRLEQVPEAGEILVFFGCRSKQSDFYFAKEWAEMARSSNGSVRLVLAASRDQEDKVYVQHKIAEEAEAVWRFIGEQNGRVYISGASGQMPKSVKQALNRVFVEKGKMDGEEAEKYLEQMEKEGRYQEETWS